MRATTWFSVYKPQHCDRCGGVRSYSKLGEYPTEAEAATEAYSHFGFVVDSNLHVRGEDGVSPHVFGFQVDCRGGCSQ